MQPGASSCLSFPGALRGPADGPRAARGRGEKKGVKCQPLLKEQKDPQRRPCAAKLQRAEKRSGGGVLTSDGTSLPTHQCACPRARGSWPCVHRPGAPRQCTVQPAFLGGGIADGETEASGRKVSASLMDPALAFLSTQTLPASWPSPRSRELGSPHNIWGTIQVQSPVQPVHGSQGGLVLIWRPILIAGVLGRFPWQAETRYWGFEGRKLWLPRFPPTRRGSKGCCPSPEAVGWPQRPCAGCLL